MRELTMNVRSVVAMMAGRMVHAVLHGVLHRAASQLPGRVALAVDPQVVAHLRRKLQAGSVVVCGTNGKTTTTNLVASMLEAAGMSVLCNRDGANMLPGVASALLPRRAADWAVIEADELSCIHILPQLRPTYLVLLNLFRDQLDRSGEIDHVQDVIVQALAASPTTTLLTCGDDPLCMGVAVRAQAAGTRVLAFGIDEDLGLPPDRVPEARFCQRCGTELSYAYRTYAQLGAFSCPSCGFARPRLDYRAIDVQVSHEHISFLACCDGTDPWMVQAHVGGVYLVYNLLAAASVARLASVGPQVFQQALDDYDPGNGRLQNFVIGSHPVVLNLAKNPTGLNQNISLMLADGRPKAVYVVINDEANDGRDVSWLWDVDFERLVGRQDVQLVMAGGHRANDLQVRLKYAGISATVDLTVGDALEHAFKCSEQDPLYVLTNYSALWPTKAELERRERHDAS